MTPIHLRIASCLAAVALAFASTPAARAGFDVSVPDGFVDVIVATDLDRPTCLAILPDGRVLVGEQVSGRIRMVVNPYTTPVVFTIPDVSSELERGLLGIAVDPRWPEKPWVYVNYNSTGGFQRIVRYVATGALSDGHSGDLSLGSELALVDDLVDAVPFHEAGCLRFGPDGCLYASLGDNGTFCNAADSTTLRGVILRLMVTALPDGSGPQVPRALITPPDNPFVTSANENARLVHSFGYRNPFRFHLDPATGAVIVGEVGDGTQEEIDISPAGGFMGWPWVEGTFPRVRDECPEPSGPGAVPSIAPIRVEVHGDNSYAIVSAGLHRPAPGAFENWPAEYDGDIFYGQYYEGYLRRLHWNGASWELAAPVPGQPNATDWAAGLFTSTDFLGGPDGSLWWLAQYSPEFIEGTGSLHHIRAATPTAVAPGRALATGIRATPNPFREAVELAVSLASAGRVDVAVYDLSGRRVRGVFAGALGTGLHSLRWDGRDDRGRAVGAGVYFARMERAGAAPVTLRVLRVR